VFAEYDKRATTTGNHAPHPLHKDIIGRDKGKGKVVHIRALKEHGGSRGIASLILNLGST